MRVLKWFGIFAVCVMGIAAIVGHFSSGDEVAPTKQIPAEKTTAEKEYDKNQLRAVAGASTVKASMRNPDSFKIETATIMDNGSICYSYRTQNGFGGMNKGAAVLSGENIKTDEMKGFESVWKKDCQGRKGKSVSEYVSAFM